jgi:hypothetical protein
MTSVEAGVLIVVVLAALGVVALLVFRRSAKVKLKGPGGIGVDIDGSNQARPAISAKDLKSKGGGLAVSESTGQGMEIEKVEVAKDIVLSSSNKASDPKA